MKVLLVNQYFWPDVAATAQLLGDLAEDLASRGWDVKVIAGRSSYVDQGELPRLEPWETWKGVEIRRVWSSSFGRKSIFGRLMDYGTFLVSAALRALREPRSDVVICLSTPPFIALVGLVTRMRGSKLVYKVEDLYPDIAVALDTLRPDSLVHRGLRTLSHLLLSRADRVVALDEAMATTLVARGAHRIDTIPNWADGDAIRPEPDAGQSMRRDMGWNGSFVVLYSGNMGLAHRFDAVIESARRLSATGAEILFAFVGGGVRRREIEIASRELANVQVHEYQPRDRLNELYNAADLHLVSLRERIGGLLVPSKYVAALAAGKPVLLVGGTGSDLHGEIQRQVLGWVCDHDPDAVTTALREAMSDPNSLESMGERARSIFRTRYSRKRAVHLWIDLLDELTGC